MANFMSVQKYTNGSLFCTALTEVYSVDMTPHAVIHCSDYLHVDEPYTVITALKCAVTCEINRQQYDKKQD